MIQSNKSDGDTDLTDTLRPSQVRDDNGTVSKQVFVRWYQRLKLRCAKSRIPAAAIGKVYDQVAPSGELDKEGFSKIIQYRDQIDYEITNELIDTAGALNHIRSLLHGKGDAKEWVTIGKLKTRIQACPHTHTHTLSRPHLSPVSFPPT